MSIPENATLAWHFGSADGYTKTYAGSHPATKIVPGLVLTMDGPVECCSRGFHASRNPIDALHYAPSLKTCSRVYVAGERDYQHDKLCGTERGVIAVIDATSPVLLWLADLVERCLTREREHGEFVDSRLWAVIDGLRRYVAGEIDLTTMTEIRRAAYAAAAAVAAADAAAYAAAYAAAAAYADADAAAAADADAAAAAAAAAYAAAVAAADAVAAAERAWQRESLEKRLLEAMGLPATEVAQ